TSSKKHKIGDVEADVKSPSHGVSQEVEVEAHSRDVSREKINAPSHSQTLPEVQVEVPTQEATVEDVEVPSNIASKAHQTASSLKKVGTKKKRLGRKGVHTSHSTIPIEEGDPDAEHKLCIKYDSDDDTPVHLYAVIDWELLPTGLGSINAIYRLDNSRKYFTSLRKILHLVTRADLMTIYGRVITFYQDKKAEGVGLVLWGDLMVLMDLPEVNDGSDIWKYQHTWSIQNWKLYSFSSVHVLETVSGLVIHMFVDKKYPLSVNLIERMLNHQLEICHGTVGNELTTAVQLIAFLKKQISDSKRPKKCYTIVDVTPLNTAPPPHVADNSEGLRDSPLENITVGDAEALRVSAKDAGKRKQVGDFSLKNPKQKHWRVSPQANTAVGNASDPLDVDSDPDFHEFPAAKELKEYAYCHFVVAHVTPLSCNKYLNEIDLQELCDIHDRAYMRQVVLDNVLKNQTRQLISALSKAMASCDELRERKTANTLQSEVERMQGEYSRLVLDEKKWVNYTQTLSALQSKMYVVPTGRVVVPTGRYIVPAGKVIIIVSTGRLSLVPTGSILSPGRVK
ncbi:hypothetical protein Tco_0758751, partial [Tanacetum coccineum]